MTVTPTVPYRLEFEVEVPGTAEEVWSAVGTGAGMSAWFMPTQMDERVGGAIRFVMGPGMDSTGVVTDWEEPRKVAYEEDWAALMGVDPELLSPMRSEFIVEAKSGGTCVVRVTTTGFGTGADWERPFWDSMGANWMPYFENLRLYLTDFAGQPATQLEASAVLPSGPDALWATVQDAAGLRSADAPFALRGARGTVVKVRERHALVRLSEPVAGMVTFAVYDDGMPEGNAMVAMRAYLFGPAAEDYASAEQPAWQEWLAALPAAD